MSHTYSNEVPWWERLLVKLLHVTEGLVLAVLPRAAFRKRLLKSVDRALVRIHLNN
jgi:hypothetical protein